MKIENKREQREEEREMTRKEARYILYAVSLSSEMSFLETRVQSWRGVTTYV